MVHSSREQCVSLYVACDESSREVQQRFEDLETEVRDMISFDLSVGTRSDSPNMVTYQSIDHVIHALGGCRPQLSSGAPYFPCVGHGQ